MGEGKPYGMLRQVLVAALIILIALPAGFVVALVMLPFWGWFEAATGIEAIGHSGPAEWVFFTMWGLCAVVGLIFHGRGLRRR
ncbi:MAG: hypothetical protein WBK91_00620 [Alphaproteobacteria bacterium]